MLIQQLQMKINKSIKIEAMSLEFLSNLTGYSRVNHHIPNKTHFPAVMIP